MYTVHIIFFHHLVIKSVTRLKSALQQVYKLTANGRYIIYSFFTIFDQSMFKLCSARMVSPLVVYRSELAESNVLIENLRKRPKRFRIVSKNQLTEDLLNKVLCITIRILGSRLYSILKSN
jgi:hypothetical protein